MEGKLTDLTDEVLYVVFESLETFQIDTFVTDNKGRFAIFHELKDEDLQVITFYYNDRRLNFSVYPEIGKSVTITGDAAYPQLLQIKGGRTNDKLSEYKKKAAPFLKGMAEIQRIRRENRPLNGKELSDLANLKNELRIILQEFVTRNPKEEASAVLIYDFFSNPDEIEQAENFLNLLSPELKDFFLVRELRAEIEKVKNTKVGAKAPDFRVTNIYGQTLTVDSFANKHFILAFTTLWCEMCQTEVMMLDRIAGKYPKDSLDILLISLDDNLEKIREMIRNDSIQWNLVADSAGQAIRLFDLYNVHSLPKSYLMDKNGIIRLNTMNREELRKMVEEVMEGGINY
jgi:peroxiredoxin